MVHVRSLLVDAEVPCDALVCDVLARLQDSLGNKKQNFRLVHQGQLLSAGILAEAGIAEEDSIVALMLRDPTPPVTYADSSTAVDLATINAAIAKERAERGQEAESSGQEVDGASDFPFLRRMMHQLAALGGLRPSPGGQVTLEPAQVQTLWDTIESCLRTTDPLGSIGDDAGPSGSDPAMADASATPLPVVDAGALEQLVGMGFPEARSRKALLLRRNSLEAAMEWLLAHGDDPDADTPLSDSQLRALAAPRAARSRVQPDPEALRQLLEMGFDEQQAAEALRATFNDQEAACAYLLGEREVAPPRSLLSLAALRNPRLVAEYRRAAEMPTEQRTRIFRAMLSGPAVSVDPPPGPGEADTSSSRRLLELLNAFRDIQE